MHLALPQVALAVLWAVTTNGLVHLRCPRLLRALGRLFLVLLVFPIAFLVAATTGLLPHAAIVFVLFATVSRPVTLSAVLVVFVSSVSFSGALVFLPEPAPLGFRLLHDFEARRLPPVLSIEGPVVLAANDVTLLGPSLVAARGVTVFGSRALLRHVEVNLEDTDGAVRIVGADSALADITLRCSRSEAAASPMPCLVLHPTTQLQRLQLELQTRSQNVVVQLTGTCADARGDLQRRHPAAAFAVVCLSKEAVEEARNEAPWIAQLRWALPTSVEGTRSLLGPFFRTTWDTISVMCSYTATTIATAVAVVTDVGKEGLCGVSEALAGEAVAAARWHCAPSDSCLRPFSDDDAENRCGPELTKILNRVAATSVIVTETEEGGLPTVVNAVIVAHKFRGVYYKLLFAIRTVTRAIVEFLSKTGLPAVGRVVAWCWETELDIVTAMLRSASRAAAVVPVPSHEHAMAVAQFAATSCKTTVTRLGSFTVALYQWYFCSFVALQYMFAEWLVRLLSALLFAARFGGQAVFGVVFVAAGHYSRTSVFSHGLVAAVQALLLLLLLWKEVRLRASASSSWFAWQSTSAAFVSVLVAERGLLLHYATVHGTCFLVITALGWIPFTGLLQGGILHVVMPWKSSDAFLRVVHRTQPMQVLTLFLVRAAFVVLVQRLVSDVLVAILLSALSGALGFVAVALGLIFLGRRWNAAPSSPPATQVAAAAAPS